MNGPIRRRNVRRFVDPEAYAHHVETVCMQQGAGFEWQHRRKELEKRFKPKSKRAPRVNLADRDLLYGLGREWFMRQVGIVA